jgi:hypothetical protein
MGSGRIDATTVVLESQPQRTTGTTAPPPAAVGIDATLLAVRQLLNNPPPSGASPSAVEQWRYDVDQLIVTAINTQHHERRRQPFAQQSRTPSMAHAPSRLRAPSVAHAPPVQPNARPLVQCRTPMESYMTADLRDEINRRRGGEDNHTTIECHRERHRNIEGRNLEKDFNSHALVHGGPVAHAPCPLAPRELGGGCMALAPHLCMMVWSHKFRPHLPEKYDGTVNPVEFLHIYSTSILAVGCDETIMANYFPVPLLGRPGLGS